MKASTLFLSLIVATTVTVTSCGKHHKGTHAVQTINATVDMNQPYQFDLGNVTGKQSAAITNQAQHYTISETIKTDGTNDVVYHYTPTQNFTGTDQVTVEVGERHHPCGEHHEQHSGNCGHHHACSHHHDNDNDDDDNSTTYIINIQVVRASTTPVVVSSAHAANMN